VLEKYRSGLPAGFDHPRQFPVGGHIPETNPAKTEFAHVYPGATTNRTAVVTAHHEFRFSYRFVSERFPGQIILLQIIDTLGADRQLPC
jgi:hypothetical protein